MASERRRIWNARLPGGKREEDEAVVIEWSKKSITADEQICEITTLTQTAPGSIRLDVACYGRVDRRA
jgi:hypothetical protein